MTLPVLPDVDTILVNSATVLRDVVLPTIDDEWGRSCTRIIAAALDYAVGLLADDRDTRHRAELEAALASLGAQLGPAHADVAGEGSPYERASRALVWSREHDGVEAETVRAALHPVLVAHLDEEAAAASGVLDALHVAMRGTDSK
ncbi:MAG: hypothetical protein U0Q03_02450 [Acidimicrobiales bacterium]